MGLQGLQLRALQTAIEAYLRLDSWFIRIPILTEELGDVVNIADQAVAKSNTCVIVETADFDDTESNVPPSRGHLGITISIWENVSINRNQEAAQVHALDTAQVVHSMLKKLGASAGIELRGILRSTPVDAVT